MAKKTSSMIGSNAIIGSGAAMVATSLVRDHSPTVKGLVPISSGALMPIGIGLMGAGAAAAILFCVYRSKLIR